MDWPLLFKATKIKASHLVAVQENHGCSRSSSGVFPMSGERTASRRTERDHESGDGPFHAVPQGRG